MKKLFEKIKKRIIIDATEACAYRENTMVISEAEIKEILEEEFEKFVTDINVGDNDWIPVKEKLPKNNDNVHVTAIRNKEPEVAIGWYNHHTEKWRVCFNDDNEFYYGEVIAWKENTDKPYQPEGDVSD